MPNEFEPPENSLAQNTHDWNPVAPSRHGKVVLHLYSIGRYVTTIKPLPPGMARRPPASQFVRKDDGPHMFVCRIKQGALIQSKTGIAAAGNTVLKKSVRKRVAVLGS